MFLDQLPPPACHKEYLKNLLATGNPGQTWFFFGDDELLLEQSAVAFASDFISLGSKESQTQALLQSHSHPDLLIYHPEGKIGLHSLDSIREFLEQASTAPFMGLNKAMIVSRADRMLPSSSNALLKTIEEPFGNHLIILTAPRETSLLPTLVSRCRRLHFYRQDGEPVSGQETFEFPFSEFGVWFSKGLTSWQPYGQWVYWQKQIESTIERLKEIAGPRESNGIPPSEQSPLFKEQKEKEQQGQAQQQVAKLTQTFLLEIEKAILSYTLEGGNLRLLEVFHSEVPHCIQALERGIKLTTVIEALWIKLSLIKR